MNPMTALRHRASAFGRLASVLRRLEAGYWIVLLAGPAFAENTNSMLKPITVVPGGIDPHPFLQTITRTEAGAAVSWSGVQGPFQLQLTPSLAPANWVNLGDPTFEKSALLTTAGDMGLVRVVGDDPTYVGAGLCLLCHRGTHATWQTTVHAQALKTLEDIGAGSNATCLPCHTVGYGWANGYQSPTALPSLANVQCENCHGPAVRHVENVDDPQLRPAITLAAEVCGGCHNGFHHPTYDEWQTSAHSRVDPDVAASILAQGEARMKACGPCHSGAVRLALLAQLEDPNVPLPSREDAAYFPVTCAVCHEPHEPTAYPAQLRNPTYSTRNFSYSTSANTSFAKQYDPDIQLCGQCHNLRGAQWTDTSRPPHHSPQYNLLVGQGGYDLGNPFIASHGLDIQQQCALCHTHPHEATPPSPTKPNYMGHSFEVRFQGCASEDQAVSCHASPSSAQRMTEEIQRNIQSRIEDVRRLLNQWATTKAPAALQAKYGTLAWEYNNPGELSNPDGNPQVRGPTAEEQKIVPDAIKQARMNLYLAQYDGSFGVHNGDYTRLLLGIARTNVLTELAQP